MQYIIIGLLSILFSGCISTVTPPKSEFRIDSNLISKELSGMSCKNKSLKVAHAFSSNALMSQSMNYVQGDYKQYEYSASRWAVIPNRAITAEFLKMIRGSKLFKSVQVSKSRSRNDFTLEINIEDFMQYFNEDSSRSHANIVVTLSLINSKTNNVVATKTFTKKIIVKNLDASGGVRGLNSALNNVLFQSSEWLNEVCK